MNLKEQKKFSFSIYISALVLIKLDYKRTWSLTFIFKTAVYYLWKRIFNKRKRKLRYDETMRRNPEENIFITNNAQKKFFQKPYLFINNYLSIFINNLF